MPFPLLLVVLLALPVPVVGQDRLPATAPATKPVEEDWPAGSWSGSIVAPGQALQFGVTFARSQDGAWTGTLDIPLQGVRGARLTSVSVEGDRLTFNMEPFPGNPTWVGTRQGDLVTGNLRQGNATMPFEMGRGTVAGVKRPQEPRPPFPYESIDVTFSSKAEGVKLAGTLTVPRGEGPFPAVVLVSGSGPQDRNEELLGHKPFLILSDRLTRAGVAVLRYDDRGVGKSTGDFARATSPDFANDAEGAVTFLRQQPKVRPDLVGIAGHSEGGLIAPMVAARSGEVAFIVLLAGPGVPGSEVLLRQVREGAMAEGAPQAVIEAMAEGMKHIVEAIRSNADLEAFRAPAERILRAQLGLAPEAAVPAAAVQAMRAQLNTDWFRFFLDYDPAEALAKVNVPVLVLQGELDRQVNAEVNVAAIRNALQHNQQVRVEVLPGLNHLFQPAKTGGGSEYAQIETTMDERVPALVAEWINGLAR